MAPGGIGDWALELNCDKEVGILMLWNDQSLSLRIFMLFFTSSKGGTMSPGRHTLWMMMMMMMMMSDGRLGARAKWL